VLKLIIFIMLCLLLVSPVFAAANHYIFEEGYANPAVVSATPDLYNITTGTNVSIFIRHTPNLASNPGSYYFMWTNKSEGKELSQDTLVSGSTGGCGLFDGPTGWTDNMHCAGWHLPLNASEMYLSAVIRLNNSAPGTIMSSWYIRSYVASPSLPSADFECNNNWFGDPAPFGLECDNLGFNGTSWVWTLTGPSGSTVESYHEDYEESILNTPGRYSMSLNTSNEWGYDVFTRTDYILILPAEPLPNVTWTVIPNATPVPLIPTFAETLQPIINRTDYRSVINSTLIGNITAPYLDFMDDWGDSLIDFIVEFLTNLSPLTGITSIITEVVDEFQDSFDSLSTPAKLFLYWIGVMFAMISPSVWLLINYKLVIEIIKGILET